VSGRLALAALLLAAPSCDGKSVAAPEAARFPALSGRVVDEANLLTPAEERALADQSAAVERETGAQYVIVTLRSLEGRPIEDYSVRLGRHWGIGRKGVNDGLMLVVAPAERKVRIEVGYGLEKRVTDPFAARVIRERLLPAFGKGRFAEGIRDGSDALVERLRSKASDAQIRALDGVAA
jgi:uncharacterized protein